MSSRHFIITLLILATVISGVSVVYSRPTHWFEIASGLFKVGTVPVTQAEDRNGNGVFDPGEEDFDSDGYPDVVEGKSGKD